MSELFRLALAAAAGYVAHRQAGTFKATTPDDGTVEGGVTTRFSPRGRFFIGLGVAFAAWMVLPVLTGKKATLGSHARRMLGGRSEAAEDSDCGCGS